MILHKFLGLGSKLKPKTLKTKKEVTLPDNFIVGSTANNSLKINTPEKIVEGI